MSSGETVQGLKVVDAYDLDEELRSILKPDHMVEDSQGRRHRLPRYFYEIPSHEVAMATRLALHFGLNEFIYADLKEASRLHEYPRYVPCAVRVLAFYLEQFREKCGAPVHISVNGGYRSPAHNLAADASAHMWGTAADIYRIGTTILKTEEEITKYNQIAEDLGDEVFALPYGHETDKSVDDHIHIDLGYLTLIPSVIGEDRVEQPQENRPRFVFEHRRRKERHGGGETGS